MKRNIQVSHNGTKWQHTIGLVATVSFLTLLIGSLIVVSNLARQSKNAIASSSISYSKTTTSHLGVYVGSNDGALFKLDAQNGSQLWRFKTKGNIIPAPPTVVNGVVYVGSQEGLVYALNAVDGATKWSFQTQSAVLSTPVVANGVLYAGSSDGYLYALNVQNGSQLWRYYTGPTTATVNVGTVAVANGVVYGSSSDEVAHSYLFAIDARSGSQLWRIQVNDQSFTDPQVANGIIYIASSALKHQGGPDIRDSYVYAFNTKDGSRLWLSDKVNDHILSSPTVANGVVYIGSQDTFLYALNATTGKRLWHHNTGGEIYTSPKVVNGVVFVGVVGNVSTTATGSSNDTIKSSSYILALNATNGSSLWQHSIVNYAGSQLAVYNGVIYSASEDSFVYALSTKDGSVLWQHKLGVSVAIFSGNAPITVAP